VTCDLDAVTVSVPERHFIVELIHEFVLSSRDRKNFSRCVGGWEQVPAVSVAAVDPQHFLLSIC